MADSSEKTAESFDRRPAALIELVFPWVVLIGGALFAVFFVVGGAYLMLYEPKFSAIALGNVPTTIGLPCAALTSLALVVFLRTTDGPIEFDVFGLKFKGASGPIVMWVLCFLSMAGAIHLLWKQ